MSGSKSFVTNLTFSSTNTKLSTVIDLKRVNVAISNRLNNQLYLQQTHLQVMVQQLHLHLSSTLSDVHILAVTKSGKKLSVT